MDFLRALADAWLRQLAALLLWPIVLGALLHLLERATQAHLQKVLGWRGVVWWTGWLGTPVHELSHAAVGTLFLHRIHEIKLWEPHPDDGVLGYVRYSIRESPAALRVYGTIGQFFSGVAPLFGGGAVLLLALRLLAPQPEVVLREAEHYAGTLGASGAGECAEGFLALVRGVYGSVFADGALGWRPWAFLYVALAVGAHLAPSPADLKGGLAGFCLFVGLALAVDAAVLALGGDPARIVGGLGQIAGAASALLLVALVLNVGNLAFSFVLALIGGGLRRD